MTRTDLWEAKDTESLKRLWHEGLSASEIGAVLGRTRNAVIGKVHREKLPKRRAGCRRGPKRERRTREELLAYKRAWWHANKHKFDREPRMIRAPKGAYVSGIYAPKPEAVPDTAITFANLGENHCRWVIGEPRGLKTIFCGSGVHSRSYCLKHYCMAYGLQYLCEAA